MARSGLQPTSTFGSADILNGVFPVGQRLLETSLATRYGVSRTPVREALAALQHEGLIERTESGFRVRTCTAEDVIEIYEARIALESAAAAAAPRLTDLDLTRLVHRQLRGSAHDRQLRPDSRISSGRDF